jgi:hypothetical protein
MDRVLGSSFTYQRMSDSVRLKRFQQFEDWHNVRLSLRVQPFHITGGNAGDLEAAVHEEEMPLLNTVCGNRQGMTGWCYRINVYGEEAMKHFDQLRLWLQPRSAPSEALALWHDGLQAFLDARHESNGNDSFMGSFALSEWELANRENRAALEGGGGDQFARLRAVGFDLEFTVLVHYTTLRRIRITTKENPLLGDS